MQLHDLTPQYFTLAAAVIDQAIRKVANVKRMN